MPLHADQVADKNGAELARLARLYEFPAFVKQADLDQVLRPGPLPTTVYADPVRRQFPCHTAASTWLSALYYQEKAAEFHPKDRAHIEKLLDKYASYWGIVPAVAYVKQRWQELHKTAEEKLPDSDFAYVWVGDNGTKERHLRLKTAAEVKAAAEYVEKYRDHFPFSVRHVMARKILEKAARLGAAIGPQRDFLERQAGMGVGDPVEVARLIEQRALLCRNSDLKNHFLKMAATVRNSPRWALHPGTRVKLAETLDLLDRQLGLVGKYGSVLVRPEDVVFQVTFSKAAQDVQGHVATTSGKVYEKSAFRQLALDDLRSLFGDEFADRVRTPSGGVDPEKMAEEAAALPRPDAELLDGLLSDQGITPVLHKAASARHGLSLEQRLAWADAYVRGAVG
jgi:hypothetical protein